MAEIILGITGSIAAYRAPDIAGGLRKRGHVVSAVMTADAQHFITPLSVRVQSRGPVVTDLFAEGEGWQPGHIELADRADLLLIAPATAHVLGQLAGGLAGDALGAIALATRAPILIAPAMNGKMWEHPAVRRNVEILRGWGHRFIGPEEGMLACGYEGVGRLWPVEGILDEVEVVLAGWERSRMV
jgi:phosphopantothenoylcysteine decarboxylase